MSAEQSVPGVLVVEDDRSVATLYAEWLGETYDVQTAHDGSEALERLDETVDVVLLDRMMPGLTGSEVLESVRESGFDPRVVMVSAVTPDLDVVQMGFDAYLEKPIDADTLRETVDRMLTRAEYDEKLQRLFSLIERQDTLEAVKRAEVLEASEEYRSLTERVETAQRDVESLLTELPEEDFRVAVERLQRTAVERTGDRRYESLTEDVLDSSREATVVVDADGTVVWANAATERLLGLDPDEARGREYATVAEDNVQGIEVQGTGADEGSLVSLIRAGLESHDRETDATVHVPEGDRRAERWLEYWSAPIETGLYAGGRIEHYHDVTGRHRREQYLRALHGATRELMTAESAEGVVERAARTATTALDLPYTAVFTREAGTGDLSPAARETTDPDVDPTLPTLSGGSDPVWTTFANRTERLEASDHRSTGATWLDDAFEDWVLCPLGRQGVLLVGTATGPLSTTALDLAETWAANTRQALEQIARTRELRERDRELKRQNERLLGLDRINRLIRSIAPAVVNADTRSEIETQVVRRLLRIDIVTGAWIADVDLPTGETVCRASAGDLDRYLSEVPSASAGADRPPATETARAVPGRRAHETRSPVAVTDLLAVDRGVWWRDRGVDQGTNAIVAVALVHESTSFGALEVHLDRPEATSEEEVAALEELGLTIGHAIGALRRRDALLAGGATRLTFHVAPGTRLSAFSNAVDLPVVSVDLSRRDDSSWAMFVTLDLNNDQDPAALERRIESTTEASVLRADSTGVTCVLALDRESPVRRLIERGVALREIAFRPDSGGLSVTVQLSAEHDVREYVERVAGASADVELVAKYDRSADRETESTLAGAVNGRLTDRQRETLQMAYHAGYFDRPRGNDAVSVADELGIAQSTFSQHLRTAERKLLEELFADTPTQ